MQMMKAVLSVSLLLAGVGTAAAQTIATATANVPVYVTTGSATPIRVASAGTKFTVIEDDGSEWVRVAFTDPVLGRRVGFVQRSGLKPANADLQPMDLSVQTLGVTPVAADPVAAQLPAPIQPQRSLAMPKFKNHLVGRSGATFGTRTSALAGVEASGDVLPMLQVYGSFDWHQDISPTYYDVYEDIAGWVEDTNVSFKNQAYVWMGGVKVMAPTKHIRPYGVGGFGVVHSTFKVHAGGDDKTDEVAPSLPSDLRSFTKPTFEVGGGVVVPAGLFYLDAGYKFRKAIQESDINMSGVYVGVGVSY